jgi:hypothetical protein
LLAFFGAKALLCDNLLINFLDLVVIEAVPLLLSTIIYVGVIVAVFGVTGMHEHRVKVIYVLLLLNS